MRLHTSIAVILVVLVETVFAEVEALESGDHGAAEACRILQERFPQLVSFPGKPYYPTFLPLYGTDWWTLSKFAGDEQYANDTAHWAISSQQSSTCSIQPETADDITAIVKIVGRSDIRSPFAVKSGGHACNLGQSSTPGVQISLALFTNISYNENQNTLSAGMGLTWDQIYAFLDPLDVMVVGGRINGVGIGGLGLGGGYSWKSNQFGLTVDTIAAYELVLPTGEQVHVTNASYTDLFFGLKGGPNNFGIVTGITLEVHPQTLVYGGLPIYAVDKITLDLLNNAASNFSLGNTDAKAEVIVNCASLNGAFIAQTLIFYDGPTPPRGVYDEIAEIPSVSSNVSERGRFWHVIPITKYTLPVLDEMVEQVVNFGRRLTAEDSDTTILVVVQPELLFQPFSHSRGGAYPHRPDRDLTPACLFIVYSADANEPLDAQQERHAYFVNELKNFTQVIQAKAVQEGVSRWDDILYANYALVDTPLELVYGENVPYLRSLVAKYDPEGVMALTGGFRFLSYPVLSSGA